MIVLGMALLTGGCDRQSGDAVQQQPATTAKPAAEALAGEVDRSHRGAPLPEITVTDPEGSTLALNTLKGPVLLNLWATWCGPCVTELPMLDRLAAERAGALQVLTVSEDMADGATVRAFLKERDLKLPAWLDPDNDLAFAYGGGVLPTTVYFDASGREVWRIVGGFDWTGPEAKRLLAETR
jgi:thiol-disulfide isomerase/thioredoxin